MVRIAHPLSNISITTAYSVYVLFFLQYTTHIILILPMLYFESRCTTYPSKEGAIMPQNPEYARALKMIDLAVQHAGEGYTDMARTVLRAAHRDGQLDRPDRFAGLLQHQAATLLVGLMTGGSTDAAARGVTKILGDMKRLRREEQTGVLALCERVMDRLPHAVSINRKLARANQLAEQLNYIGAFTELHRAMAMAKHNQHLTSRVTARSVTDTGNAVMTHLLQNNSQDRVMAIMRELRAKGLVEK